MNVGPIKLTNRQEHFAQLMAAGASSAREAYAKAYGRKIVNPSKCNGIDVSASNLLKNPKVAKRIEQIKVENAAALRVSVQSVTKMLTDTYHMAQQEKQASAAAQAAM